MSILVCHKVEFDVDGYTLEGAFSRSSEHPSFAILLLHPHPRFGGNMNNHVVRFLEKVMLNQGYATFRFDFRGTSSYPNGYSGIVGSVSDATSAVNALIDQCGIKRIGVVGYSYGGSVALHIASLESVEFLVTLSASLDLVQEVVKYHSNLEKISCPVLMFHGDSDMMVPFSNLQHLSSLITRCHSKIITLQNEGHFYETSLDQVKDEINEFMMQMH